MGGAPSVETPSKDKMRKKTVKFVDFDKFKEHGEIPRYPVDAHVCVSLDDNTNVQLTTFSGVSRAVSSPVIPEHHSSPVKTDSPTAGAKVSNGSDPGAIESQDWHIDLSKSLVIFVSHRWLRSSPAAPGYDGKPHPDNANGDKYKLIVQGVEALKKRMMPDAERCFLWIDYSCLNQDRQPGESFCTIQDVFELCDCMFTPLVDDQPWEFERGNVPAEYSSVRSTNWCGSNETAYLRRGWCRAELFCNITVPLKPRSLEFTMMHFELLKGDLRDSLQRGRRPHFVHSTTCRQKGRAVMTMPSLQPSFFTDNPPAEGHFTVAADKDRVVELMHKLQPQAAQLREERYEGSYNEDGLKHGAGKYFYSNGDEYDGEWVEGKRHGFGNYTDSKGNVYEGQWREDQVHGKGKWTYSNGNVYEGEFEQSLPHGKGKYIYFTGAVYEGEHRRGKKHGFGKFSYSTGDVYEGKWQNSVPHGSGKYMYTDGTVYVGEYNYGQMRGHGKMIKTAEDKSEGAELKKGEERSVSDICEVDDVDNISE